MSDYEESEEEHYQHKTFPPPPFAVGEQVWFTSPSTGRMLQVEFRGWDKDLAVVRTQSGLMRVQLASLRKVT